MRTSVRKVLALALALAGAGCTASAEGMGPEVATPELVGSVGVLHVERVADERELSRSVDGVVALEGVELEGLDGADTLEPSSARTELSAAFARYRGLDSATVLGLLGGRSPADLEACTFVGADDALVAADVVDDRGWGEVELLDVGTMRVRVADTEASLSPRAFPDLASVLAGVFYAGDASLAVARADADEYTFRADGSTEVPAFEAIVPAPAAPTDLRVDTVLVDAASIEAGQTLAAARDAGLDLTWAAADARDLIEIEIRSGGDVLACASRDDGQFRIGAESLATLAPDAAAAMIVRRVRVTPVDVPGLDDAFARIAITRELAIDLR